MRALRAAIALCLVSACGESATPPARLAWSSPPPAEQCAVAPEAPLARPVEPRPEPAAARRAPPRRQGPAPRLFGVGPEVVRTPAPFLIGEPAAARADLLDAAFRVVGDLRRQGVARVDVPAGSLSLRVSGDRAAVVLSGTF